jgi:predicted nucleic acid-binding protein
MVALAGHHFWRDEISLAQSELIDPSKLLGHRQVTDAHLVALAIHHGGRLVSFDRRLRDLVPAGHHPQDVLITLG